MWCCVFFSMSERHNHHILLLWSFQIRNEVRTQLLIKFLRKQLIVHFNRFWKGIFKVKRVKQKCNCQNRTTATTKQRQIETISSLRGRTFPCTVFYCSVYLLFWYLCTCDWPTFVFYSGFTLDFKLTALNLLVLCIWKRLFCH